MLTRSLMLSAAASALALTLSACGGSGGGGGVASIPPAPPPSPPPPPTAPGNPAYTVNIFQNPKPETYATVGIASGFSTAAADQPQIRYNAGGYYEMQVPGGTLQRLGFPTNVIPEYPDTFNYFVTGDGAYLFIDVSRLDGYRYSEMGSWSSGYSGGVIAFGSATPVGQVPVTGSATYDGKVDGSSDILQTDFLVGGKVAVPVVGTVELNFNFGAGTLGGSMHLQTAAYASSVDLGTFAFKDTVYSAGSSTYSGAFKTPADGDNFFLGQFTGPHAEETIGAWALPFNYSVDGETHQAFGAWIAKQ